MSRQREIGGCSRKQENDKGTKTQLDNKAKLLKAGGQTAMTKSTERTSRAKSERRLLNSV